MFAFLFYTLYPGYKSILVLRNPLHSLFGNSLPTLCTHDSIFGWMLKIFGCWLTLCHILLHWLIAVQCIAGFYLCLHCWEVSSTLFLWDEKVRRKILYNRMKKKEWLTLGVSSLSAWNPFFRQAKLMFKPMLNFLSRMWLNDWRLLIQRLVELSSGYSLRSVVKVEWGIVTLLPS